jgi:ADP-ribose pyrophosphatase YjhB (NUDIX family)
MSKILFKVNVSTVIIRDGRFLLIKRSDDEDIFPGMWGIPGGTLEPTDLGVVIGNSTLIANDVHDKGDKGAVYLVYKSEYISGEPKALDGTAEVHWLDIEHIRPLELTPTTLDMIELCQKFLQTDL